MSLFIHVHLALGKLDVLLRTVVNPLVTGVCDVVGDRALPVKRDHPSARFVDLEIVAVLHDNTSFDSENILPEKFSVIR